jgi:hypothetical protein
MLDEADPGKGTDHRTVPGAVQDRAPCGQARAFVELSGEAGTGGDDEQPATAASTTATSTASARRPPGRLSALNALMSCSQAPGRGETAVGQHSGPNAARLFSLLVSAVSQ